MRLACERRAGVHAASVRMPARVRGMGHAGRLLLLARHCACTQQWPQQQYPGMVHAGGTGSPAPDSSSRLRIQLLSEGLVRQSRKERSAVRP